MNNLFVGESDFHSPCLAKTNSPCSAKNLILPSKKTRPAQQKKLTLPSTPPTAWLTAPAAFDFFFNLIKYNVCVFLGISGISSLIYLEEPHPVNTLSDRVILEDRYLGKGRVVLYFGSVSPQLSRNLSSTLTHSQGKLTLTLFP